MPYKTTPEADNDLIDIYVHGFKMFGERQAEKYFSELENRFQLLSEKPLICRERTEFIPPVRIHHHARHLILVVRVLHDSMDLPRHLLST